MPHLSGPAAPAHVAAHRAPAARRPLVVASVPSGHVYVRHLAPEEDDGRVVRLPDPDPDTPQRPAGARWWPPVMLRPEWARDADFDLLHLHFGFDAVDPSTLRELTEVLRGRGKPFVLTVHDLRNPHHEDRALHDAQLDVLVPAADALVTLTTGAAAEIRRRWDREALVLPHPHVVPLATMEAAQERRSWARGDTFRVGLHVKSLRASMAPMRLLPTLVDTVAQLPGAVLQVNGHRDVLDPDGARRDESLAAYLHEQADAGRLELHVHDFLDDRALWAYLASLDVSVLPYRFGTHSGWLEACRDLGTAVVAPTCGFYADQGPVLSYTHDESHLDEDSLAAALRRAHEQRSTHGISVAERRAQRARVAAAHDRLYTYLLTAGRA
ncbi:glycosyltransferase family 1 protein [uncultured Nocardioides sp.]|uniref:glycosyltransferase family 1 protein n=1 Tax=uncultured Nocardioides sp. TaxID=198441 RepID=UPI0026255D83|nr:glycosyltransferase family 1 protein [uncultured Nocardioides sp.]